MAGPRKASGGKADWAAGDSETFVNIPDVTNWDLEITSEGIEYRSSSTNGKRRRVPGDPDAEGSLTLLTPADARFDGALGIRAGEIGRLKLYEDATKFFTLPVYVESASYGVPIGDDELIEAEVSFSYDARGDGSDADIVYPVGTSPPPPPPGP